MVRLVWQLATPACLTVSNAKLPVADFKTKPSHSGCIPFKLEVPFKTMVHCSYLPLSFSPSFSCCGFGVN